MLELLTTYSVAEILIFVFMLAVALKGVISLWDWIVDRLRKVFTKEAKAIKDKEDVEEHFKRNDEAIRKLTECQVLNAETFKALEDKINLLIDSDKDDIKSWITEKHHFYVYQQEWIDDYTLDCIEKRYHHYKDEGGNSFIRDLMIEIRQLPHQPPQE